MRPSAVLLAALSTALVLGSASSCRFDEDDDDGAIPCVWQGRTYPPGQVFPAGDGCNSCSCEPGGEVACTLVYCGDGDGGAPAACAPSGDCVDGPMCGGVCCDVGEQCVDGVCRCGENPACMPGDECVAGGPVGGDTCGGFCCGASGPCPL